MLLAPGAFVGHMVRLVSNWLIHMLTRVKLVVPTVGVPHLIIKRFTQFNLLEMAESGRICTTISCLCTASTIYTISQRPPRTPRKYHQTPDRVQRRSEGEGRGDKWDKIRA
jgi:hypothetical protein